MTVGDIQTLMLSWLDDMQGAYFTPAQTLVWINLAQRKAQMELLQAGQNWYMMPVQTVTVQYQQDYVLPDDFMVEHRLELVLSGTGFNENRQALTPMTTNQSDLVQLSPGTPTNYYIKKDRVTIFPTPDQANMVLRLYYSPRVQDLTSTSDVPDVPEQFMEYVAILATFNGFIKDDRAPDNLVIKRAEYEQILQQMKNERTQDLSRQVVLTEPYQYGSMY
jgi:hypothetical protein